MVDQSRQVDYSGNTLLVNDLVMGVQAGPGAEGVSVLLGGQDQLRYTIKGVNFNSATTDNAIAISLPSTVTTYSIAACYVWGASHTLTTATAGLFSAASAGGTAICADQALTPTSGTADTALNLQSLTIATAGTNTCFTTAKTLYFRVGTAESATATGNVTVLINLLG